MEVSKSSQFASNKFPEEQQPSLPPYSGELIEGLLETVARVTANLPFTCLACNGDGRATNLEGFPIPAPCPLCNGQGTVQPSPESDVDYAERFA